MIPPRYYTSRDERRRLLDEATAAGEALLHDDHKHSNGAIIKNPDGTRGKLTFYIPDPKPPPTADEIQDAAVRAKPAEDVTLLDLVRAQRRGVEI